MRWRTGPVDASTFNRALAIVRASRVTQQCQQDMTAHRGRKRSCTYEALFTVLQIAALERCGELLLSDAAQVVVRLIPAQREVLGIERLWSYALNEQAVTELSTAMRNASTGGWDRVNAPSLNRTEHCHEGTHRREDRRSHQRPLGMGLAEFMTSLTSDFIPPQIAQTVAQAVDSTDYEAHARRRSWKHLMIADIPEDSLPELEALEGDAPENEPGWPLQVADGRHQHTVDPDARDGYRAGKNRTKQQPQRWPLPGNTRAGAVLRREAAAHPQPPAEAAWMVRSGSEAVR